jgi:hypothetical protein
MNSYRIFWAALAVLFSVALVGNEVYACNSCGAPDATPCTCFMAGIAESSIFASYDSPDPAPAGVATSVPIYNSLPGAHAKLFLDFDGINFAGSWGGKTPGVRPAYDINGNTSIFSANELARIEQIWSRVAEAFSMFNVNVTTQDPGNLNYRETARIVISGDNSWYGSGGGVAFVGGFNTTNNSIQHTAWVFPGNLRGGDAKVVADATIHEAGHLFGLQHQSAYDAGGTKLPGVKGGEYDNQSLSVTRAPNMGVAYDTNRGLWAIGAANASAYTQVDELSVIAGAGNGFGFIPDEIGVSFATAPEISLSATPMRGVIARSSDIDYYKIDLSERSQVSLLVDVAPYGPTLDARLQIFGNDFALLHDDDPTLTTSRSSLQASFNGVLEAGAYYLGITSHGGYSYVNGPRNRFLQDAGQYFLSGAVIASVPEPAAMLLLAGCLACAFASRRRCVT